MRRAWSLFSLMLPLSLGAQMLDVQPGVRVRVSAPGVVAGRIDGTVIGRTQDSIVVATPSSTQYRFELASLSAVEVYQSRSHARGAWKGALWGGGVMLPLALLGTMDTPQGTDQASVFLEVETVYAGVGAIIGSIIGADSWSAHKLTPNVAAGPGGLRLGAAIRF